MLALITVSGYCYENLRSWRNTRFDEEGNVDKNGDLSVSRQLVTECVLPLIAIVSLVEAVVRFILSLVFVPIGCLICGCVSLLMMSITIPCINLKVSLIAATGLFSNLNDDPISESRLLEECVTLY